MKVLICGLCCSLAGAAVAGALAANPILSGWRADPQIRLYDKTYWIFPTGSDTGNGFDAFSSTNLAVWTKHVGILRAADVSWARECMWAPDAHEKDGKYYLFFSANDAYPVDLANGDLTPQKEPGRQKYGGIGVAVADRPEGPYRDLIGKPLIDQFWNRAQPIDQYVFVYKGDWYMAYGGWGRCNLVRLADDFKSLRPLPDGKTCREITPKGYVEGSVLFERKGIWYFMYSSGSWTDDTYCVKYATANTPFGPFEYKGDVLSSQRPIATGPGHHSVLCLPGTDEWYVCYHRRPIPTQGPNHRVTCLDRMFFDANGDIRPIEMTGAGGVELTVENDHTNLLYAVGEEATFTVTARRDGKPLAAGTVDVVLDNFGPSVQLSNRVDLAEGNPFMVKGMLSEPGFLRLTLDAKGGEKKVWSVAYDPERIEKGSPTPDDFDAF